MQLAISLVNFDEHQANRRAEMKQVFANSRSQSQFFCTLCILTITALFGSSVAQGEQPNHNRPYAQWVSNYEIAVAQSERTGRPIMLVFSGSDWCGWCNRLADEVFKTHDFARWSTDHVIKVEVDFPMTYELPEKLRKQNELLKQKFGQHVNAYPTVLFVSSDGQFIGKTGYVAGGPSNWIHKASTVVKPRRKPDLVAQAFSR